MVNASMFFAIFSVFQLSVICSNLVSKGSYFIELGDAQDEGSDLSLGTTVFSENFHKCSLVESCKYLSLDMNTKKYTQISNEDEIPKNRTGFKIWKKVSPEGATYRSCKDAYKAGNLGSGVIKIRLPGGKSAQVYCDMETDGGGWTVFLRRVTNQTNFNRTWQECTQGFGDLEGNFWLGLDTIHYLTNRENVTLRIDLKATNGTQGFAKYTEFLIAGRETEYTIHIGGYAGDIGDSMETGYKFSTWDNDNDNASYVNCAATRGGPWWHNSCGTSRLMNLFFLENGSRHEKMKWKSLGEFSHKITFAEMKLRE
ncbi:fibrinogen-like protein A isoform X2 [Rhopilema esculentum]|uniref:fibrinogen-like protein A isoform X2 n=1 Tax=Rhopilema esculentum TaxID=499914 RepID=UPI0031D94439